jgi:hypothetical protein
VKAQPPSIPSRLKAGAPGLGEAAQIDVERRAAELARIDGRTKVTDADVMHAARELAGTAEPVAIPGTDDPALEITAWDDPVDQSGHRVPPLPLEDEAPIAERLIGDGLLEADHDTRVAAEEGDPSV